MPKRNRTCLDDIADLDNLYLAFYRAAAGKSARLDVIAFRSRLDQELSCLRMDILDETVDIGKRFTFRLRDPKPRTINAACFRERILHHAIMARIGSVLDRGLVDDTFACRTGKGMHAAIAKAQHFVRRYPWYARTDIRQYFDSIDHGILKSLLRRRLKDPGLLRILDRIIDSYYTAHGKGLPIGALTSQYFANLYLNGLDRLLLEELRVSGMIRYMDDIVWWGLRRGEISVALNHVRCFLSAELALCLKSTSEINRSSQGLTFCGVRVHRGMIRLRQRGRRRYTAGRARWECAYDEHRIDGVQLQQGYGAVVAATLHCDASRWRNEELLRNPVIGSATRL